MIGLDTNILIRHLAQDDPVQSPQATIIIEHELTEASPGFVSLVVMVESAWVLRRTYRLSERKIAAVIEQLLETESLVVECETEVHAAMMTVRERGGSFADALVGLLGINAGCVHTITFDRKAARLPGFTLR